MLTDKVEKILNKAIVLIKKEAESDEEKGYPSFFTVSDDELK